MFQRLDSIFLLSELHRKQINSAFVVSVQVFPNFPLQRWMFLLCAVCVICSICFKRF